MELHLAPLENLSCWAFRKQCPGATDSYTGMLSMADLVQRNNGWKEVDTFPLPGQRQWIQVATAKEQECLRFIKRLDDHLHKNPEKDNVHGIQINASCPSPHLIRLGQGPALVKRATKVANLLQALLTQDRYKVGIKLRLGMNPLEVKQRKILDVLGKIEQINHPNLTNVTIHVKHAQQKSRDPYDYDILKEIVGFRIPLVINGGINTAADIRHIQSGIDAQHINGYMVGRAAMKDPNVFALLSNGINGTKIPSHDVRKDFYESCKLHEPKPNYLKNIQEKCPWAK